MSELARCSLTKHWIWTCNWSHTGKYLTRTGFPSLLAWLPCTYPPFFNQICSWMSESHCWALTSSFLLSSTSLTGTPVPSASLTAGTTVTCPLGSGKIHPTYLVSPTTDPGSLERASALACFISDLRMILYWTSVALPSEQGREMKTTTTKNNSTYQ